MTTAASDPSNPFLERFLRAWESGSPARIEDVVRDWSQSRPAAGGDDARRELVLELIRIDLEQRWLRWSASPPPESVSEVAVTGIQTLLVEAYLKDLAGIALDENAILDLLAYEYRVRHRWGDRPGIGEYGDRFQKLGSGALHRLHAELTVECSVRSLLSEVEEAFVGDTAMDRAEPDEKIPLESLGRILAKVHPFTDFAPDILDALALHSSIRTFEEGEVLLSQGEAAECLFVILDGTVEVSLMDSGCRHSIARLEPHTIVGEIGLFARERRSATVTALCPGQAAVIPREVFEHIAGNHPGMAVALSELIAERVGTLTVDVLCGKVLNGYRIRGRLGRGGMGIVYAATSLASGEDVALKMLRHDLVFDRFALRRFRQEAAIVQSLRHPNIVRVWGEFSAYGTCFITMELCDGLALGDIVERSGPLPERTVRAILGQLAGALAHAHRSGIAHRDIKPSNILIGRDGIAKLTDFGLARCPVSDSPALTAIGQIVGTPRYMAPEQLLGERGDEQSDTFALGAVAYELITGRPLFRSNRFRELVQERRNWSLPAKTEIQSDLDDGLFQLLMACLADEPQSRNLNWDDIAGWSAPVDWNDVPRNVRPAPLPAGRS